MAIPRYIQALFLLCCTLPLFLSGCGDREDDTLLFRVNGEEVYQSELELIGRNAMAKAGIDPTSLQARMWLKDHAKNLYDTLIRLYLIQQTAQKTVEEPTEQEVTRAIESFREAFPSEEDYARFMEVANLEPDEVRTIFRNKILTERFQKMKLQEGKTELSEEELREWYNEHAGEFRAPNRLHLRHILFLVDQGATPEERVEIREKAERIRKDLTGADEGKFAETAKRVSEDTPTVPTGGDLGFITLDAARPSFPPGIAESIFELEEGEISPVLQSKMGYHIFMVADDEQSFEEAKEEIRERLQNQAMISHFEKWFKETREQANIEIVVKPEDLYNKIIDIPS